MLLLQGPQIVITVVKRLNGSPHLETPCLESSPGESHPHALAVRPGVFVFIDIQGLIDFKQKMGGVADDIRRGISRENNSTNLTLTNHPPPLQCK